jgi:hypothetical protein
LPSHSQRQDHRWLPTAKLRVGRADGANHTNKAIGNDWRGQEVISALQIVKVEELSL